ncbi:hypothetical protein [Ruania rhizosphaerae]|uniref:hypothetical protein n=1 Tax=Ruania rhizosphaerae TaxID=1840413 RepID=UPI00190F7740|nr:hypothetical protein [Ruania rhizosphaerae]
MNTADLHNAPPADIMRRISVPGLWLVHAYYTVSPYRPDGSGMILAACADLERGESHVVVLDSDGHEVDRFGTGPTDNSFFHTGRWQTWSADGSAVFYGSATPDSPRFFRRDLHTGAEDVVEGSMDGGTPNDGPLLSGLLGMLQASNHHGSYHPDLSPVPIQERDAHGLFEYSLDPPSARLRLSAAEVLAQHPDGDRIREADEEARARLGADDGLTLLVFCVRWSPDGSRLLFFYGNNGVPADRGEPRIKDVVTLRSDLTDLHVPVNLSHGRRGVHWSWQPDNERLIGYGPDPDDPDAMCLAEVRYDGSGYRRISPHSSGGHPSVSPTDPDLIVTDHYPPDGRVCFISRENGQVLATTPLPLSSGSDYPPGRSPHRIDAHPVFHPSGGTVLCNSLPGPDAALIEIAVPQ